MLINAIDPEESRIAVVEDGVLQELHVELASREAYLGNIYKGKVVNIEPSIGAAFVAFGGRVNGFLHVSDVLPAYGRDDFRLEDVIEGRARVDVDDGPESMQQALALICIQKGARALVLDSTGPRAFLSQLFLASSLA